MDLAALRVDADPSFDRLARIIREALNVPVALVSIVEAERQVFPGAVGLPEPWQDERETPLSHSFCQYVVLDQAPLIIEDARLDPRLHNNLAVSDLGVIAYAGFPLRDADGDVVGSVCAIQDVPRQWQSAELMLLADIAEVASVELQLRGSHAALARSAALAAELSARARVLLTLSESLADTVTATEVASALQDVAGKYLGCAHAGIWVTDADERLAYVDHPIEPWPQAERHRVLSAAAQTAIGEAVATRQALFFPDQAVRDARFPEAALPPQAGDGQARAVVPLAVGARTLGALALVWDQPRDFSDDDRLTISALASYTAQAVHRAGLLAERTGAARTLQAAMLTDWLPTSEHAQLAARYVAVAERDEAGGDWYDARLTSSGALHVTIGDVQGHDLRSAAVMGSLRNMLRTLDWALDESPASILRRLDQAVTEFAIERHATVLLGRLERDGATGDVEFEWSSAGHPPPIVASPDGECRVLEDGMRNDCMLWVRPNRERRNRRATLPAGSTLLLYTDGLIETRRQDVDTGIEYVRAALGRHRGLDLEPMLDAILADTIGPRAEDDVALLAVRIS
ncbi:GAF domain-containing SpoIIE family protein phosphatase [uncultured Jatrophihabitans sp.]|uniref:GAF domain-containing SpoIIE family protein phosphatase n=1 Tax=uncultured Jatrophihabitans sp. TaxID=1610747 RepID=UPI0035C9F940